MLVLKSQVSSILVSNEKMIDLPHHNIRHICNKTKHQTRINFFNSLFQWIHRTYFSSHHSLLSDRSWWCQFVCPKSAQCERILDQLPTNGHRSNPEFRNPGIWESHCLATILTRWTCCTATLEWPEKLPGLDDHPWECKASRQSSSRGICFRIK